MIRPGIERIKRSAGGLHKFMNWQKPILTDSGGFQVMSLSKFNKVDREKGAIFNSHVDGKKFILKSRRKYSKFKNRLDSDIVMVLDECPKKTNDYNVINNSMELISFTGQKDQRCFWLQ